jgi:hypothetical protein
LKRRPDLPPGLAAAVERALEKRPEDRFQTGAGFREAVLDTAAALPPLTAPRSSGSATHGAQERHDRASQRPAREALNRAPAPSHLPGAPRGRQPEEETANKIGRFRRSFAGYMATIAMLFGINVVTGGFPWFIFPTLAILVGLMTQLGSLWGDGVPLRRVFFGSPRQDASREILPASGSGRGLPATEVLPPGVMEGPHGVVIRRAMANRQTIMDVLDRIGPKDRKMLPDDILATAGALVDRVSGLATTLHRVDEDANGSKLGALDDRIQELRRQAESPERSRRISLLERQRATLGDLLERRTALLSQMESASLALENLKLDLIRFRTAGVSAALEDVTSATREARSVSREIGHVLEAVDEVKRL